MPEPSGLAIRRATKADFYAIDRVHAASVRVLAASHYDAETVADWSAPRDRDLFEKAIAATEYRIAEAAGDIVGFAQLDVEAAEVKMLYVDPRSSRMGVGHRLMADIEAIAWHRGITRLTLRSSLNAVQFYRHSGWLEVSPTTHRLRSGRELSCVLMEKELADIPSV